MNKIRTLISYDDINFANNIEEYIKSLDFIEIVGKALNGKETYNKIIELQPEMVFSKYNMEDMKSIEILKGIKQKLNDNTPVFNFFADEMPMEEVEKAYDIIGDKLNSLLGNECDKERIITVLKDYKEYMEKINV